MSIFWTAALNLIVRTLPYRVLSYYPVRDRLRVPGWQAAALICISELLEAVLYGWSMAAGRTDRAVEFLFAPVCMLIYFFCVRADVFRLLFLYLFIADYILITTGLSLFVEARLFYSPDMAFYTLRSSLIQFLVSAVTIPFTYYFFKRTKERVFRTEAPRLWKTIWLVPALTTFVVLVFTTDLRPETVVSIRFLLARVAVLVCILVVYSVLLQSLDTIRAQAAAEEKGKQQEQLLAIQRSQFEPLKRHIEETRKARHDLRQHLNLIQAYLDNSDEAALQAYITAYGKTLPKDTEKSYCRNCAVDLVIRYYAEQARKGGIDFLCQTNLPETLPMDEPELCALLGNLLENAVYACRGLSDDTAAFIRLHMRMDSCLLSITVDNTCPTAPIEQEGLLFSTRHEGYGVGTQSVRSVAERHQGFAQFEWVDGEFHASVLLCFLADGGKADSL
ncbi:ATP-binding protein [Hungatella hathewayi]|uniref:ATP-binding protein n=1 Tax=Hungatella hathewayi TaxID=154046 RepID=UPI00356B3665